MPISDERLKTNIRLWNLCDFILVVSCGKQLKQSLGLHIKKGNFLEIWAKFIFISL